ncbi:hypothetical protein LINGRAHAP2_LOCUS27982, partial [Linum grandiflorum]
PSFFSKSRPLISEITESSPAGVYESISISSSSFPYLETASDDSYFSGVEFNSPISFPILFKPRFGLL